MERIKVLIENKQYKDVYKYIIKNFGKGEYNKYFLDIKNVAYGLVNIGENSKALSLFRKLDKIDLEKNIKLEIIKILTKREKYKSAYRYIIKNFGKGEYSKYFLDIKNVAYSLVNIGERRKALRLFSKIEELGKDEEIKIEIMRILTEREKYIFLYRYIISNFKEQYYDYIREYIFSVDFEKLRDIKLLEIEKICWYLLGFIKGNKILDVEIRLTRLYCCRKINFINKLRFMDLINNKIYESSDVTLKKFYNKILNLLEQRYGVTNIKSFPQCLSVQLTSKCNAKCKFCEVFKGEWELPDYIYNEILEILPILIEVSWLGGEVFFYKHFRELFQKAKENGIRQVIITNAMLLTEQWIDDFISSNLNLAISISSTKKDKYEYLTEGANFEKLISKLEYLKKQFYKRNENFKLSMFVLVTKYNYMELEQFIEFAHNYKFDSVRFIQLYNIIDNPKSDNICSSENETHDDLVKNFNRAIISANKYGIKIKNELPLNVQNEEITKNEKISEFKKNPYEYKIDNDKFDIGNILNIDNLFCVWPWEMLQIDNGGDIFFNCFCRRDKRIFGNVSKKSMLELWNSEKVVKFREAIINNNYKNICNEMCIINNVHKKNII